MPSFLSNALGGAAGSAVLFPFAIAASAFFFEDATTVVVGVLAADGAFGVPRALLSLYAGVAAADAVLYSVGLLARTHPRLAHYINHEFVVPFRIWLENRYPFTIFSGHFVPGLRFTTYVASGFFRSPFPTFALMAAIGNLVWVSAVFTLAFWFGGLSSRWGSVVRWGVAALFIAILFLVARHNLRSYQAKKNALLDETLPGGNV